MKLTLNFLIDVDLIFALEHSDFEILADSYVFDTAIIKDQKLPHYRYFHFKSGDISFSLRIDGGIAHCFKPMDYLKSEDIVLEDTVFAIRKDAAHDIIYNIGFDRVFKKMTHFSEHSHKETPHFHWNHIQILR